MKNKHIKKFVFLLLCSINLSLSQTISGIVSDSITGKPLELASIIFKNSNFSVFTDVDGNFKIDVNIKDSIQISNIGYETQKLSLKDFSDKRNYELLLKLKPKVELLDEISIAKKKLQYSSSYYLKTELKNSQYLGFQFGTENCTLIENPKKKYGKLISIILNLGRDKKHAKGNKLWKIDYLATYRITFYKYDSIKKQPSSEIYSKNLLVEPQNKTYRLKIDLDSLNIKFPKEGLCVGVEIINTRYKNPKKTFAIIAPSFKFTEVIDQNIIMSWIRYRDEGREFKPLGTRDKKGKYSINNMLVIDANIKYEK